MSIGSWRYPRALKGQLRGHLIVTLDYLKRSAWGSWRRRQASSEINAAGAVAPMPCIFNAPGLRQGRHPCST